MLHSAFPRLSPRDLHGYHSGVVTCDAIKVFLGRTLHVRSSAEHVGGVASRQCHVPCSCTHAPASFFSLCVLCSALFAVLFLLCCRLYSFFMEPVTNSAEQRLYLKFFEHLGISEQKKLPFLFTLLRNLYDAASKLDLHLSPYGATLHCAVSRMVASDNPEEVPTHRWIWVFDRLGFFTDANTHSELIVNLGLAYAYRHLEANALAEANALLLRKAQPSAGLKEAPVVEDVPRGGALVSTGTANPAAGAASRSELEPGRIDGGDDEQEEELPSGGLVVSANAQTPGDPEGDSGDNETAEGEIEGALPPGGLVVSALAPLDGTVRLHGSRTQGGSGVASDETDSGKRQAAAATAAAAVADSDDLDAVDDVDVGSIPPHVLHDHQPTVHAPASAVKVVASVLRTVMDKPDGKDVLRKLLGDGVLCLARSRPEPPPTAGTARPTGAKADAAAVQRMCRAWWPHWKAPQDLGSTKPLDGTLACLLNRKRFAASSRWAILVNLPGVISALEDMNFKSAPLFKKDKLPVIECVQRVSGKSPMKMTVVIACMLLLVTKEEQCSSILTDLAFSGRADVNKNAPLTNASRHEFITSGLAPSASMGNQASKTGSLSTGGGANASVFDAAPPQDLAEEYLSMASDLALDNSKEAKRRRAQRMHSLKAKPHARGARPPVPPASTVATGSVFVANGTRSAPSAGAAGGGPVGAPVVVTVLQGGNASAASQEATKTAPRQRPSRSRKATAGVVREAPAAVRGGAADGARGRARVPAGRLPAAPPLSTGDATAMPSATPKQSVPAGAPIEPGGLARMEGSGQGLMNQVFLVGLEYIQQPPTCTLD